MKFATRLSLVSLMPAIALCASAHAGIIHGTGEGTDPRDSSWKVIAGPSGFTPPSGDSYSNGGYSAYVIPDGIPPNWLGGAWLGGDGSNRYTDPADGVQYRWISAAPTAGSLVGGAYHWVVAQTFTVEEDGYYSMKFRGAADELMYFFIDGTLNTSNASLPTISGGTQIGTIGGFGAISEIQRVLYMGAGQHTAYMALRDTGWASGALITSSSFTAVPVPGAAALLGAAGLVAGRRRRA
jgi:MYXO-CTERM domain-containing protein